MDTFSVGLPTVLATKLLNKKSVIRTGGDFLWEGYIGRTGKKVFFRDFYNTESNNYSNKEIIIFKLSKWTMKNVSKMIFSTEWQRDIFIKAYDLEVENTGIIENYYGEKIESFKPTSKEFLASTRDLKWKNLDIVRKVFDSIKIEESEVVLFSANLSYEDFMQKMKSCYAVILLSLGDISPNMILDAIRFNKPFICTKEVGIFERIKDAGVFVDPLNEDEIKNAVLRLLDKDEYQRALERIKNFSFTHSWEEIAYEFLNISKNLK